MQVIKLATKKQDKKSVKALAEKKTVKKTLKK